MSKDNLQGMEPLMIFYLWFSIGHVFSIWDRNVVLFKEGGQLVDLLLHTMVFRMINPHTIGTSSLFELLLPLGCIHI